MGTGISDVNDLFMSRVSDHKLTTIYTNYDVQVFNQYLEPWLLDSIVKFEPVCDQDLTYTTTSGSVEGSFTQTLTLKNKTILSQLMVLAWLEKTIQDITQMNIYLQDKDYRLHAASQNLKAKQDYYIVKLEEMDKTLGDYEYRQNFWSDWRNQDFVGSG
jgi:hypothetical protein